MTGNYHAEYMRDSLPPRDVWTFNPETDGLLETPTKNGLVDLDAVVESIKATVESDYTWTSTFNDVHHLQWMNAWYTSPLAKEFRELPQRKAF